MSDGGDTETRPLKLGPFEIPPGPGAIGANTIIMVALAVVVITAITGMQNEWIKAALVLGSGGLAWWLIVRNFEFAEKAPAPALLNSGDLRRYLLRQVVSKGEIGPPEAHVIENPEYREVGGVEPEQ